MSPDFIGIGVRRCASSWLNRILEEHPEIGKPRSGLHFFNLNLDKGREWYEGQLEEYNHNTKIIGEFSTTYSYPDDAATIAELIHNSYPEAKIIVSIREPVARSYSDYLRSLRLGEIEDMSFEEAMRLHPVHLERSFYAPLLRHYFDRFPANQIKVISFDEISSNAAAAVGDLYDFLGVDESFKPTALDRRLGATYEMKSVGLERMIWSLQSRVYKFLKRFGLTVALNILKRAKIGSFLRRMNTASSEREKIDKARQELHGHFDADIRETMALTGLSLEQWLSK